MSALLFVGTPAAGADQAPFRAPTAVAHPIEAWVRAANSETIELAAAAATWATPEPSAEYCPVPAASFVNSWGARRSGGRRHKGVDMMAPHGSPVYAPVGGTVRHSNSRLGGLGFYLEADDGNEYFGSHLSTLGPIGPVEAGAVLGTVGSTGNARASGPHLHFEVITRGGSVNPYPFAVEWCDGGRPATS